MVGSKKDTTLKISQIVLVIFIMVLSIGKTMAQTKEFSVDPFDKVIVSPHIQVNFVKGDKESVYIEDISVPIEKLNIEESGKTLHIYLEGAKTTTKSEKVHEDNYDGKRSIYQGTIVQATITYKNLNDLSLRGEETFVCKSLLEGDKFQLKIYGESEVSLNDVKLNSLNTTIYGEAELKIRSGNIGKLKITSYGESEITALNVQNEYVKITAYGEGEFRLNVSKELKVTAYGEAQIEYKGNPEVNKGIIIGETTIRKIDY